MSSINSLKKDSLTQKRDSLRQEAHNLRDNYHRSEQAVLLSREEFEVPFQSNEARETSE